MENKQNLTNINWYPGHMAKTRREIGEVLKLIDIVYEVIDARMPISSKIIDMDDMIKGKPRILIMTKYDLCDQVETNKFIEYYESLGYIVIPVDLMSGFQVNKIVQSSKEIFAKKEKKRMEKGMNSRNIRSLIVGIPNVGKSTLINRLVGKKVAGVANRPGFTKNLSWIRIHKDIELLDTPGILWPKLDDQEGACILAALSSIKEEILNVSEIACFILRKMFELYPERLKERYGIFQLSDDFVEEYELIARRRGALLRGGEIDYDKVSKIIIQDLRNGYLGKITLDRLKNE